MTDKHAQFAQSVNRLMAPSALQKLLKELRKLQRDLNSHRLMTYLPGDVSEEEQARKRERSSKLARFNEILSVLNQMEAVS